MEQSGRVGSPSFGTLLRNHRLAAGLSQEALAERARMSAVGISALERGLRRTPQRETLALLAGALALSDEQRAAFEEAAGSASPRRRGASVTVGPWPSSTMANMPFKLTNFVGREAELAALRTALGRGGAAAVYGPGGVGKSSAAREYAARNAEHYSVILWLDAQTEDGIIDGLLGFRAAFARGLDEIANRREAAQQVINSVLRGFEKPALLIFDNLGEERHLRAWRPRTGTHALITSRNAAPGSGIPAIQLEAWPLEIAVEYLRRESSRTDLTEADARAIAQMLGTFPLALSHAAASLRNMRMLTPERYLRHVAAHLKDAPLGVEYSQSVFATFKTAISQAEHEAAGAAAAISLAALFAPDAIPDELFRQTVENYAEGLRPTAFESTALDLRSLMSDEVRLDAVLGVLDRMSLLVYSESSQTYSLHRLVQLVVQDLISADAPAWQECAVAVADAAFPNGEPETWTQCARLLPHVRVALQALPNDTNFLPAARLASSCGHYLTGRGDYNTAEALHGRAVSIRERRLGPNHLSVAFSTNNLATVYAEQCRYGEAESLYQRALAILESSLGPDHPDLSRALNNLGLAHLGQERYQEAETVHKRALAIREAALGEGHPDVAHSLDNLAQVYTEQGRYAEAELACRRALAIREKALSSNHPDLMLSMNNLAVIYGKQGQEAEAESFHLRALAAREQVLGPNHPDVAESLSNLGEIRYQQGRVDEAEALLARALEIWQSTHGAEHPEVATTLASLARVYEAQERGEEVGRLYLRALTIREKRLGLDHPKTRAVRDRLRRLGQP